VLKIRLRKDGISFTQRFCVNIKKTNEGFDPRPSFFIAKAGSRLVFLPQYRHLRLCRSICGEALLHRYVICLICGFAAASLRPETAAQARFGFGNGRKSTSISAHKAAQPRPTCPCRGKRLHNRPNCVGLRLSCAFAAHSSRTIGSLDGALRVQTIGRLLHLNIRAATPLF